MKTDVWEKCFRASADPQRARHFYGLLAQTPARQTLQEATLEQAQVLCAVFSGSVALSTLLLGRPDWLTEMIPERLEFPRRKSGMVKEINAWLLPALSAQDYTGALRQLREFKQREMLRIATRDLALLADVPTIIQEISDIADLSLNTVWQVCYAQFVKKHGLPYHQDADGHWQRTEGCVLGMGKLGGQELNYSSDVDVLFAYTEEGNVFVDPPGKNRGARPVLANHQFFNRLAEAFIAEVTRLAPEGTLFRIDLRLRPEGDGGPLSRSLAGYENYYAQWGQTWERMMLIKARGVAGNDSLAAEFIETIHPFRYPRTLNHSVLREVAEMKDRIENEVVKTGELDRNVKLGRGGIREIEFIAQSLQLLHAGRQPFLQGSQTLPCLEKLTQYDLLTGQQSERLSTAYKFLRKLEHRLQMEDNRQTHTIPVTRPAQERLAKLMGFKGLKQFNLEHDQHRKEVRHIFETLLKGSDDASPKELPFPREFETEKEQWKTLLQAHQFRDIDKAFNVLREFVEGPGFVHVSTRTRELALNLLPRFFGRCPKKVPSPTDSRAVKKRPRAVPPSSTTEIGNSAELSDPDRVLTRLDSFIAAYGARPTLFEMWNSNPAIFDLLVSLFDRSEFLAELAIRTPDVVDELVISGRLRQRKSADETLRELRHGLTDKDQYLWLRKYQQTELMRIGLRDILGLADFEQYLSELSALADACLNYALEVTLRKNGFKKAPFVIIGLGKLGGAEIDYGSDLDILFVADSKAADLPKLAKLALEANDLISRRTEQGLPFHTDARLRPDGEKGLLVNTLKSFEDYYRQRAQLWEIQSLTRTRAIAGNATIGVKFQKLAALLTNFKTPSHPLTAFVADWEKRINDMRLRIQNERTPKGKDELAIKTGKGGLMDAEFIAQVLCLRYGWQEANTLRALDRGRTSAVLPDPDLLIENYRRLRRLEGILRRWSYEGETVLPDDPAAYLRVAIRCGFSSAESFRVAVASWRAAIRDVYLKVFAA